MFYLAKENWVNTKGSVIQWQMKNTAVLELDNVTETAKTNNFDELAGKANVL